LRERERERERNSEKETEGERETLTTNTVELHGGARPCPLPCANGAMTSKGASCRMCNTSPDTNTAPGLEVQTYICVNM